MTIYNRSIKKLRILLAELDNPETSEEHKDLHIILQDIAQDQIVSTDNEEEHARMFINWLQTLYSKHQVERPIKWKSKQARGTTCCWCGKKTFVGVEHIIPRSAGGPPIDLWNLAWACYPCNQKRAGEIGPPPESWMYNYLQDTAGGKKPDGWLWIAFSMVKEFPKPETLKRVLKNNKAVTKKAGQFTGQCKIYNIQEYSFSLDINENEKLDQEDHISHDGFSGEYLEEQGFDYYDILEQVENIFQSTGVKISRSDNFFEACIEQDGNVCGASVIYYYINDGGPTLRFSVAVNPSMKGGGIGRKLVESIISQHHNKFIFEAFVINPIMAKLLENLGFDGNWSQDNPMMYLY